MFKYSNQVKLHYIPTNFTPELGLIMRSRKQMFLLYCKQTLLNIIFLQCSSKQITISLLFNILTFVALLHLHPSRSHSSIKLCVCLQNLFLCGLVFPELVTHINLKKMLTFLLYCDLVSAENTRAQHEASLLMLHSTCSPSLVLLLQQPPLLDTISIFRAITHSQDLNSTFSTTVSKAA